MDALRSKEEIQQIVSGALDRRFPKIRVSCINVREGEDEDGDEIVEITIVFDSKKSDFEPAKVPAFLNEVADALLDAKNAPFPVLSFVAKSDWGKPETA
jgi:hypothetical protein